MLAVLDSMIEWQNYGTDECKVNIYYKILEEDDNSRQPNDDSFDLVPMSVFQIIATSDDKELLSHDLVKMMLQHKRRTKYFSEVVNYLDFTSAVLLLTVIPLRWTNSDAQWPVLATDYVLWVIKIFKFDALFDWTAAYTHILWRLLSRELPKFAALFVVILLAFSGSFLLVLREHHSLQSNQTNCMQQSNQTIWDIGGIFVMGLRTLGEAQSVIDYANFPTFSFIMLLVFIFICCVVLMNILIAQLIDTYGTVNRDVHGILNIKRALIVTRMEQHKIHLGKHPRIKYYMAKDIVDLQDKKEPSWKIKILKDRNQRTREQKLTRQKHANIQKQQDRMQTDIQKLQETVSSDISNRQEEMHQCYTTLTSDISNRQEEMHQFHTTLTSDISNRQDEMHQFYTTLTSDISNRQEEMHQFHTTLTSDISNRQEEMRADMYQLHTTLTSDIRQQQDQMRADNYRFQQDVMLSMSNRQEEMHQFYTTLTSDIRQQQDQVRADNYRFQQDVMLSMSNRQEEMRADMHQLHATLTSDIRQQQDQVRADNYRFQQDVMLSMRQQQDQVRADNHQFQQDAMLSMRKQQEEMLAAMRKLQETVEAVKRP
ncbi:hypothetical protein ScPMuIL_003319 [Solemya velum]